MSDLPARVHLVAGGFPPGQPAGHDHDYARLRLLGMLDAHGLHASVSNDFEDVEKWLPRSRLMITYTAGPILANDQALAVRDWIKAGGRWLGLHGTSGGKAARMEGTRQRRMVKMEHHITLGGFFINHPPVRRFNVDVPQDGHIITRGLPERFEVIDEPYMIEVLAPQESQLLLTADLGPDPSQDGFGFSYEKDTSLLADGKTRSFGYTREVGDGGVTYIALGHCHTPSTNSQPFVDTSVDPEGKTPPTLRVTWETDAYVRLLNNAIEWGMGAA